MAIKFIKMRYEDYLRNPSLTVSVINSFIKNDCKVRTSKGGWTIMKSQLVTDNQKSEGSTYINILVRDDLKRPVNELNYPQNKVEERLKETKLYLTCICYDRHGLGEFKSM